jgi:hypothetical protein
MIPEAMRVNLENTLPQSRISPPRTSLKAGARQFCGEAWTERKTFGRKLKKGIF